MNSKVKLQTTLEEDTMKRLKKLSFELDCNINDLLEAIIWKLSITEIVRIYRERN